MEGFVGWGRQSRMIDSHNKALKCKQYLVTAKFSSHFVASCRLRSRRSTRIEQRLTFTRYCHCQSCRVNPCRSSRRELPPRPRDDHSIPRLAFTRYCHCQYCGIYCNNGGSEETVLLRNRVEGLTRAPGANRHHGHEVTIRHSILRLAFARYCYHQ